MKKLLLTLSLFASAGFLMAQDCTGQINTSVTNPGLNPNPLPDIIAGQPYNHVNTVVIPISIENTLSPQPGDSFKLCAIRVEQFNLDSANSTNGQITAGFNYTLEIYANNTLKPVGTSASSEIILDTTKSINRICARIKLANPPMPINSTDSIAFKMLVRGAIDLDGPAPGQSCTFVVGPSGEKIFIVKVALKDMVGIEDPLNTGIGNLKNIPNPATNQTVIKFNATHYGQATIKVYNMLGKTVFSDNMAVQNGKNQFVLHTGQFQSGIYMYSVTLNNRTRTKKMIVSH